MPLKIKPNKHAQLNKAEKWQLHSLTGQFDWVPSQTGLDTSYNAYDTRNAKNVTVKKMHTLFKMQLLVIWFRQTKI